MYRTRQRRSGQARQIAVETIGVGTPHESLLFSFQPSGLKTSGFQPECFSIRSSDPDPPCGLVPPFSRLSATHLQVVAESWRKTGNPAGFRDRQGKPGWFVIEVLICRCL